MTDLITRAAVIGAGTMGAAIAAHLANAGFPVVLLDAVPATLTPDEEKRGLTLKHPAVRNRLVRAGLERCVKASPANFALPEFAERIVTGNTEDDMGKLSDADWIIEAIFENLDAKQALMARVEAVKKPGAIVSSNTSGIPIGKIAEGRSAEFKQRFLGTHFFNPPRYLKLLEVIPTPDTAPEVLATIKAFGAQVLGKGVVICKDTPNFIGNRIGSLSGAFTSNYIAKHGYGVEEVDAITGPLIGNPKTATFRLLDLVGLDVAAAVGGNLYDLIPNDESREIMRDTSSRELRAEMVKRGWLGNKSRQGFYKEVKSADGKREYWALDTATMEYKAPQKIRFESVGKAMGIEPLGARLKVLLSSDDRAGKFLWDTMSFSMAYAARRVPEIADEFYQIDNAMKWGYQRQMGPFEIWDALGVAETAARMEAQDIAVAPWVKEMLAAGYPSFYRYANGLPTGYYDLRTKKYQPLPADPGIVTLGALKAQGKELKANESASLIDMGDGVLCLEFHTKTMNAIDQNIMEMMGAALDELGKPQYAGMVIGSEGEAFSAGANVGGMAMGAQDGNMAEQVGKAVKTLQDLLMRVRYSPKPVVAATAGMSLGGGAEVAMACARIVAHLETYMGLVETGLGLVPGGGGVKEMLRRTMAPMKFANGVNPQPFVGKLFQTIAQAKVSASAFEARANGFLTDSDRIVFGRDRLLGEAKREVLKLVGDGYRPPLKDKNVYVTGRDGLATLKVAIFGMRGGNYATEYDTVVAKHLANIICGGDLSSGQWVPEQYILDLEREAFVALVQQPKTMERIWAFLQTGRPVRN
ncbi:MAG: enoyl-CoA hydratase/isomerase family protein [Chloroflexi bacterium]|nr:enoyl-CoA hydratase/isomerase family protein [Chloroflexota bacterium]